MSLDLEAIKAKIEARNANTTLGDFFHDLLALVAEVESQRRIIAMLADHCQASGMADVDRMRAEYERRDGRRGD